MSRSAPICAVLLLSLLSSAQAGFITVFSDARDGDIRDNGGGGTLAPEFVAGRAGDPFPPPDNSAIMFFELPVLAVGQFILTANLKVTLNQANLLSTGEDADLYGLGYVMTLPPENDINDAWYYSGDLDIRTGNDLATNIGTSAIVKIADGFATTSTPAGDINTDDAADTVLTDLINSLYTMHGAQGGDYLVMRLSANQFFNATPSGGHFRRYRFFSRDNIDEPTWPALTLEVSQAVPVPEPSSMILFGMSAVGAWGIRRRHRQSRDATLAK